MLLRLEFVDDWNQRQPQRKGCALALSGALGVDGAAVQLDDVARDGQAQPEAAVQARRAAFSLPEPLEHVRFEVAGESYPGIADDDLDVAGVLERRAPRCALHAA